MRGGQVSMEYILVTGFSFLLLLPVIIMFYTHSSAVTADLIEAQARTAGQELADAAQEVYYAGPPSRQTVTATIPKHVTAIEVTNQSIYFTLTAPSRHDLLVASPVPLVPTTLSPTQGPARIRVQATPGGVTLTET